MTGLLAAVGLLTRFPVPARAHQLGGTAARSSPWFPLVGGAIGLWVAGTYALGAVVLPAPAAAVLAVAAGVVATGALHEDGLADVADAAGGWTAEDRARILDDPRHGSYGVLALVFTVALRVAALSALAPAAATGALVAAHALGRTGAVALMAAGPPAGQGLGAAHARQLRSAHVAIATCAGLGLAAAGLRFWAPAAIALSAAATALAGWWARRRLGGVSGDVLGAAEQLCEIAVLLLAAATLAT